MKKEQVTEKVYFVTFRLVEPPTIDFRAGQNMMLMCGHGINRTMSIASPPSQNTEVLMVHDISPMGPGSKWTLALNVGDTVTVVAPTGGALSFIESPKKKIMVATGTGVAPFHAMILDYLTSGAVGQHAVFSHRQSPDQQSSIEPATPRPSDDATKQHASLRTSSASVPSQSVLVLYWGLRFEQDVYWKEEFDRISSLHPNFIWHQVLSKPTDTWQGLRGHVTEHVLEMEKDKENSEFYLCGSRVMIEEVRAKLFERNVPKEQIKTELFY